MYRTPDSEAGKSDILKKPLNEKLEVEFTKNEYSRKMNELKEICNYRTYFIILCFPQA